MTAATPTGAELRARRERLGLSEAWIEDALDETPIPRPFEDGVVCGNGYGETRRLSAEGDGAYGYYEAQIAVLRTAYAAALTAEEQRRAAALLTEPVAPEGVHTFERDLLGQPETVIRWSSENTELFVGYRETEDDVRAARYYLELVTHRAAQHAAGEQQRRIDAVRAAEEALRVADELIVTTNRAFMDACDAGSRAAVALAAARKEAGL